MVTNHKLLIVKNLCSQILIGMGLIRSFKIIINPLNKNPLRFPKGLFKKGVRLPETIVLPARRMMLVQSDVCTSANLVATVPFNFDPSIMVANGVSPVVDSKVFVPMVNIDTWDIRIQKKQQIACFQTLKDPAINDGIQAWGINNVLPLGDTSSFVRIGDDLTAEQVKDLSDTLNEYIDAFSTDGKIGNTSLAEHKIELLPGSKPFREKARKHPQVHVEEARKQIQEMLKEDIVQRSESPWCSEYVMVKKKTNEWRMCVDFRRLNNLTKKDSGVLRKLPPVFFQIL